MKGESLAEKHKQYFSHKIEKPLLATALMRMQPNCVIDVGAGDGSLLHALHVEGFLGRWRETWAVDLSEERLRHVREISPAIRTVCNSAEQLQDCPSGHFDCVISTQVIEHVKNDGKMIAEISRITRPGGMVYIDTVFKHPYAWYFYKNAYGRWVLDPTHEREYENDSELLPKFAAANLSVTSTSKTLFWFPIADYLARRLGVENRTVFAGRVSSMTRRIRVPIPGYYCWAILARKRDRPSR